MEAKRDENRTTTLLCALNTDGVTTRVVFCNVTNHALLINDGVDGSDFSVTEAPRDENRIPVAMAVSSSDGITPVELYADSLGSLLIQST